MTCFLTNLTTLLTLLTLLTFLTFLTAKCLKSGGPFVRNVRLSDKSDCACGDIEHFSLSLSRVSPSRARNQICQKTPTMIRRVLVAPEREVA